MQGIIERSGTCDAALPISTVGHSPIPSAGPMGLRMLSICPSRVVTGFRRIINNSTIGCQMNDGRLGGQLTAQASFRHLCQVVHDPSCPVPLLLVVVIRADFLSCLLNVLFVHRRLPRNSRADPLVVTYKQQLGLFERYYSHWFNYGYREWADRLDF